MTPTTRGQPRRSSRQARAHRRGCRLPETLGRPPDRPARLAWHCGRGATSVRCAHCAAPGSSSVRCKGWEMSSKVYLETTIVSYLTARPSRDLVRAAHQEVTSEWWSARAAFELYVSQIVLDEAAAGDPDAAA